MVIPNKSITGSPKRMRVQRMSGTGVGRSREKTNPHFRSCCKNTEKCSSCAAPGPSEFQKLLEEDVEFIIQCDALPGAFKAHYLPLIHRLQSQTKKEIIGINPKSSLDLMLTLMGLAQAVKKEKKYWNLELHQVVEEFFDFFTEKEDDVRS